MQDEITRILNALSLTCDDVKVSVDGDTATVQIATSKAELDEVQNAVTLTLILTEPSSKA